MAHGDSYITTGQVRVSDAEAREHENLILAKRVMSIPSNQQLRGVMDKQKAWEMLAQLAGIYKGTLQEHQAIQQALTALEPEQVSDAKGD